MTLTHSGSWRTAGAAGLVAAALIATGAPHADAAKAHSNYPTYNKYFNPGKRNIPATGTKWVPQGLANWGKNRLVISYYDGSSSKSRSRLVIVDRASGKEINYVELNTYAHVGGLAYTKGYIWLATGSHVSRYSTSKLSAKRGSRIIADNRTKVPGKASYAFGNGHTIWVGNFNDAHRDYMYQLNVSSGRPKQQGPAIRTPSQVQGVAVTPSKIIWSTSYKASDSRLIVWPRKTRYNGSTRIGYAIAAPPRAEGLALTGNRLYLVYESGAYKYRNTSRGRIVRTIHNGSIPPLKS